MKPKTYTKLYVHIVFAVKHRESLLTKQHRDELFKYISGIITNNKCKSIIINGYTDHIHILVGLNPVISISNLVADIKRASSLFINEEKKWFSGKFYWQDGYGAFSYSRSQIDDVYNYILNQEKHHKTMSFKDEYLKILNKFDIEYNDDYLFDFFQ